MNAPPPPDGFFWCAHCKKVVSLSEQQVAAALDAPAGSLLNLKCPGCHHPTVEWRAPAPITKRTAEIYRTEPVTHERGCELFERFFGERVAEI